jgi:hypothetical protein
MHQAVTTELPDRSGQRQGQRWIDMGARTTGSAGVRGNNLHDCGPIEVDDDVSASKAVSEILGQPTNGDEMTSCT